MPGKMVPSPAAISAAASAAAISAAASSADASVPYVRSAEPVPSRCPPPSVSFVCLGQQLLMMSSYTIIIPHSNRLAAEQFESFHHSDLVWGFTLVFVINLTSGLLIAVQNLTGGLSSLYALYMTTIRHKSNFMTGSIVLAMLGALTLVVGASCNLGMGASLTVLFVGRLIQGMGNGANYSAKEMLTAFSSTDMIPTYFSRWNVAGVVGRGTGTLVVAMTALHPDLYSAGSQIAAPLLVLCALWVPVLFANIRFAEDWSRAAGEGGAIGSRKGGVRQLLPMEHRERLVKILTSVFLGFARHFVRTMWEAVSSLIFEVRFGYSPFKVAWVMSVMFFSTIPMVLYFPRVQPFLSDSMWMHAMVCASMMGTILMWIGVEGYLPDLLSEILVGFGSLFVLGPLAIHATMSDFVGVKLADSSDWLLNPSAVILMQSLSKNVVGQVLGPVIGRITAVWPWRYFAMTVMGCLLFSEVLTYAVFDLHWSPEEQIQDEQENLQDEHGVAAYGATSSGQSTSASA